MAEPTPTPEQREARIAELRRRRRARIRMLAMRGSLLAGVLTLLIAGLLYWLLTTIGGRDVLLGQIVARLPADATFTWREAEGPAAGPLTLRGVHFAMDGMVFEAERITLDPALRPLIGRTLRLDAMQVEQASLDLPESDEPFEMPRWPDVLPQIEPPLALQADDVQVDGFRLTRTGEPLIDIRRLRGGLRARPGELQVEEMIVDSDRGRFTADGNYVPGDDFRTDLTATAVLPAPRGRTPPRLGLVARGDLSRMDVGIAGAVPGPLRATLTLRGGEDDPRWQLQAQADALDLGLLTAGEPSETPLKLRLDAEGVGGSARLQGELAQGDFSLKILPSQLRLHDQVLEARPLQVETLDGRISARGHADFSDPENGRIRFAVNARDVQWGAASPGAAGEPATPTIAADADLGIAGTMKAWAAIGTATLRRDNEQATITLDGRGNRERVRLQTFKATMPTGTLDIGGHISWAPALGWELEAALAGFDPGYFLEGWDGAVDGRIRSKGGLRDDGALQAAVDVPELGGRLRDRPLDGRAQVTIDGDAYQGELALSLGGSRLQARGTVARTLDVDVRLSPVQLADLLPDAAGTLNGTVSLSGARNAPDVDADLIGSGLTYGDYRAETFTAKGRLPWRGHTGALTVQATGLQAGIALQSLDVRATGAVEALQLDARAQGEIGRLDISGNADKRGDTWQGRVATLQLAPAKGAQWRLRQPAAFRWTTSASGTGSGRLDDACLASSVGGSLCVDADWPRRGLTVAGEGLPLALAEPYLPEREDGRTPILRGEIAIDAQLRPAGNAWTGEVNVNSATGGMKFSERARSEPVSYENLALSARFDPGRIDAELGAAFNDDGRLDARLATGWDAYAPLSGEVAFNINDLIWMELFSPDIVEPKGRLDGRINLAGTRDQPRLGGRAELSDFTTELPSLGIVLHDGRAVLAARDDGTASISGQVRSGNGDGGVLAIDGTLGWQDDAPPLELRIHGERVLVSDTRDLRAVASPDVQVRYAAGEPMRVTGTVEVPSARIDLERLDSGVPVSDDVVVLDPVDPEDSGASPLDLDLVLALGDDVKLNGFGLEGTLGGNMRVRARPGREMTASGELDVAGRYEAYGQKLRISRGHLMWSNGPVSDPVLDIRAERAIGDVTAGVDIGGRVSAPSVEVWSNPATTQSNALAYLTLGRPLSTASDAESEQLSAAGAALSAGGSVLASQLGTKLGLDDAGAMESRTMGSVFGFGKRLSPRLYVGYGVSLLGSGTVLTLKYLLGKGFDVEIESSTVENRASLNWRKEK